MAYNTKTNLQILLEVLALDSEEEDDIILEYFKDQNLDSFDINGETYRLYDKDDIRIIITEQLENNLLIDKKDFFRSAFLESIEKYVDFENYISDLVEDFDKEGDFDDYYYITYSEGFHILKDI